MRFVSLATTALTLSGAVLHALAAASPLSQKLSGLAARNGGIVKLDSALYDEVTKASTRDFSVSVVLTAMGAQFKCQPCQTLAPEHAAVARSWSKQKEKDEHFFAVLDFTDGQAIYQRLQLQTAPTFQYFKPTTGPRGSLDSARPETFNFGQSGFTAEAIVTELRKHHVNVKFSRPIDKSKLALSGLSMVFTLGLAYVGYRFASSIFNQRFMWAVICVAFIVTMNAGYMWNKIRNPPYMSRMQNGMMGYIAGGYQNQVAVETHIISAIYGVLAFSAYTLAFILPNLRNQAKQRMGIYVWTGIQVVLLGTLMNIFRLKQPDPFKFF